VLAHAHEPRDLQRRDSCGDTQAGVHAKVTTTLAIYTHLFADDHAETMAALEAMSLPVAPNVVPIRRRG
jgi:hypothetical protein